MVCSGKKSENHHKDHLGNVRVAFTDRNDDHLVTLLGTANDIEVTQQLDYYPFGLQQQGQGVFHTQQEPGNRYRYNGKEVVEEVGLQDYGGRWYDPAVARWIEIDPLADASHNSPHSPYNYVVNNPISNVDPDGLDWFRNNETGEEYWEDRTVANDGETHLGAWNIVEGKNGYVIHHQQDVVGTVSKSEEGAEGQAQARLIQGMSSEQPFDEVNPRATEALIATGELIPEMLLTFAPVPKAGSTKSFTPAFKRFRLPKGSAANHVFSGRPGKFADTPANRKLIESIVNGGGTSIGKDRFGKEWFVKTLADGRQGYVYAENGIIKGAGFNLPARPINQIMPR